MDATLTDTHPSIERAALTGDRGAARSAWIAGGIVVAIVLWMGSGFVLPSEPEAPAAEPTAPEPPTVLVRNSEAQLITLTFSAEGQALPDRDTGIRAEASGTVTRLAVDKGADVRAGDLIAELSSDRAEAEVVQAEEEVNRASREFNNASQLLERGLATADRVAEARAILAAARAQVTAAEQTLRDLRIVAPFDGRIETLSVEEGEYATAGETIARIVDNSPLTIAIQVPQQSMSRLEPGQAAEVSFITGQTREGEVSFVGTAAASETRTFLAEIRVDNADGAIPAGVSAEVVIPTGSAEAHLVAPSIVSLSSEGDLGIKTVDENGRIVFHPVEIVRADVDGIWVDGLPQNARIVTVGQGFVQEGDVVRAQVGSPEDSLVAETAEAEVQQ